MNCFKRYRDEKGLTQAQLADQLGVKQSTIAMWESGDRVPGKPELIRHIEQVTGIPRHEYRPDLYGDVA